MGSFPERYYDPYDPTTVAYEYSLAACSRASRRALSASSNVSCMRIMVRKCYNPTIV